MSPESYKIISHSPAETKKLGLSLASFLSSGDVISFCGDLGAGKTTFIQGLANGLGVTNRVTSPTFALIKEYRSKDQSRAKSQESRDKGHRSWVIGHGSKNSQLPTPNSKRGGLVLYHFDLYRLKFLEELPDLGYEEYFYGQGVSAIEWGDKIVPFLPSTYLEIRLKLLLRANTREIEIIPHGSRWARLVRNWLEINTSRRNR